jgi:TPR repeat protein
MRPAVRALFWLALLTAGGCGPRTPPAAHIEAFAMQASQQQSVEAERRLRLWAEQGVVVAQRELGLLYAKRPALAGDSVAWLSKAARRGDAEAACALGDALRARPAPAAAWPWYAQAAALGNARAALMLGLMARNGEGVARNPGLAVRWLNRAAERGNAHAMFLLANIVRDGEAGTVDPTRARAWLEQAAEHGYPAAIQELALTVQHGDALSPKDGLRAAHLLKEANEHRHNNWNHF